MIGGEANGRLARGKPSRSRAPFFDGRGEQGLSAKGVVRILNSMAAEPPYIAHLDADAFFVSCELAGRPDLRGRPVAVGGRERGIISSASYEARARGVYTPMPTTRALRVCPELVLLPHSSGVYGQLSGRMFELCESLTPMVERASIDEGYLDLRPCGWREAGRVEAELRALQQRIRDELGLPVSFGLAANKLVAQIASKPFGFVVVPPGEEVAFLAPLPLGKLPGVGEKTEARLAERGLRQVADLAGLTDAQLEAVWGSGWREARAMAAGRDDRVVQCESAEAKSYSQQETFARDIVDPSEAERVAKRMLDELLPLLRAGRQRARTLTVKVRYGDFSQESAGRSLPEASDMETAFYPLVPVLLRKAWSQTRPLRLLAVRLSGLSQADEQLDLFSTTAQERQRRLAAVMDKLNAAGAKVARGHQLGEPRGH